MISLKSKLKLSRCCRLAKPPTPYLKILLCLLTAATIFFSNSLAGANESNCNIRLYLKSSIEALSDRPEEHLGRLVQVSGILQNQGSNYFKDLRVILVDPDGNFIYVNPWLPLEIPPAPPGSNRKRRPPILSNYLGKQVRLVGVLERSLLKGVGPVYALNVHSAELLE